MDIILTENVENLGKIGDMLKVKAGYARNSSCPGDWRSKPVPATCANWSIRNGKWSASGSA